MRGGLPTSSIQPAIRAKCEVEPVFVMKSPTCCVTLDEACIFMCMTDIHEEVLSSHPVLESTIEMYLPIVTTVTPFL